MVPVLGCLRLMGNQGKCERCGVVFENPEYIPPEAESGTKTKRKERRVCAVM
jgi:hypothetical protein